MRNITSATDSSYNKEIDFGIDKCAISSGGKAAPKGLCGKCKRKSIRAKQKTKAKQKPVPQIGSKTCTNMHHFFGLPK